MSRKKALLLMHGCVLLPKNPIWWANVGAGLKYTPTEATSFCSVSDSKDHLTQSCLSVLPLPKNTKTSHRRHYGVCQIFDKTLSHLTLLCLKDLTQYSNLWATVSMCSAQKLAKQSNVLFLPSSFSKSYHFYKISLKNNRIPPHGFVLFRFCSK